MSSKLFNWLTYLPFQILRKMIIGITRIPLSNPIEILFALIMIVTLYASIATEEYNISLIAGSILGFYLFIKGRKQK